MPEKNNPTSKNAVSAANEAFVPIMRELVRAYQAFADYSDKHIRNMKSKKECYK